MVRKGSVGRALSVAVSSMLLLGLLCVSSAQAASPWWHLTSGSRPGHLQAGGTIRDEVQEIVVSATEGDFVLEDAENHENDELPPPLGPPPGPLPFDATPAEVQVVLEGFYGAENVEVSAGEGDAAGDKPYVIKFMGNLGGHQLARVGTRSFPFSFLGRSPLGGGLRENAIETREAIAGEYSHGPLIVATAANLGDAPVNGEGVPVSVTDRLPHGLKALFIEGVTAGYGTSQPAGVAECSLKTLVCTFSHSLPTYAEIEVRIAVAVEEGATGARTGELNEVEVTGGEAPAASIARPIIVSREPTPFGVEDYEVTPEEEGGAPDTQAGSHPFQVTGTLAMNQLPGASTHEAEPVVLPKDISSALPPGLIGNPTPFPQCTAAEFFNGNCPQQSVIGVAMVTADEPSISNGVTTYVVPIDNLEPQTGEPARFGFLATKAAPVFLDASLRSGADYGVTLTSDNITQTAAFLGFNLTFWGVPGDPRHDAARGFGCLTDALHPGKRVCDALDENEPPPFLVMPTSCASALSTSVEFDSWEDPRPAGERSTFTGAPMGNLDGCNKLGFTPAIRTAPDGHAASTPSGLSVDVHVPQDTVLAAEDLAESAVKNITVALPSGMALNPAGADGLQACSEGLVGFTGFSEPQTGSKTATFTPTLPVPLEPGSNFCPDSAKIGTVRITTPLLPNPLTGAVYLATQNENPFGSLIAMYIVAEDSVSGALVKLAGQVQLTETGQIVATFENSPELAFEDAELHFFGGERAPLGTPARCGAYTTQAAFVPWSEATRSASASSTFDITTGPNDASCPGANLPFGPSLTAGTTSIQAGGFSPFTTTISREDGQQSLRAVSLHMPPGLSGLLAGVKLCGEAAADAGTCGAESQIGETIVSVGLGGNPFSVKGGKVFVTGPYRGAPFGLSIVNPAVAGPFNLGQVVVRAKIEVDPHTAALTITTDGSGPYAIPTILDGIPLQIQHVNVTIDRPGFTFNPTDCAPLAIAGSMESAEGANSSSSVPFQVTNCASLKFAPKFSVSAKGHASHANGESLAFKVSYPQGALGTQAWFKEAKFTIPKQLPARLPAIQQACIAATFEDDRSACPVHSIIGHAVVHTPVLPVPLEGSVYFVSYGGASFPDAVLVLDGDNVHIELHGHTFISKTQVTSVTFDETPDVPFESIEVKLPAGPFSEFGANLPNHSYDFCGRKLTMPTVFKAQNGREVSQSTPVTITGCARVHIKGKKKGKRTPKKKTPKKH